MGYAVPGILLCTSVAGIVSTSITINSYLTTNKPKDTGFKVSMAFLIISIFLFFGSAFWIYKTFKGGGATAGEGAGGDDAAAAAALAAKLGGVNLPSTNEVAEAIPNVKAFTNVPSLRAAQQAFNTAVEKTKAELNALKESVNKRSANKQSALQQAAEILAAAQAKGG
jgi:ABC-type Na+ efflux pump permease subunit